MQNLPLYAINQGYLFCPRCFNDEICWNEDLEFHNICCECGKIIEIPNISKLKLDSRSCTKKGMDFTYMSMCILR